MLEEEEEEDDSHSHGCCFFFLARRNEQGAKDAWLEECLANRLSFSHLNFRRSVAGVGD